MSYSTDDCKKLLDSDAATAGTNQGPWKRLSKKNGEDGVERIFSDKAGSIFVRIVESAQGLEVRGTGKALSDVDVGAPAGKAQTNAPVHAVDTDAANIALAEEIIQDVENCPDISEPRYQGAYTAIANRFRFGYGGDEEGELSFIFIPDTMIKDSKPYTPDFQLPIQELMPFPEMSESPNDSGEWFVGGFDGNAKACIRALLDRGFVWDERAQHFADPETVGWVAGWIAKGAKVATPKAKKPFTESNFPQVDTVEGLKALLAKETNLTLFVPHPDSVREPDFWRQLNTLAKQSGQKNLTRVPPGSELANALAQNEGPTQSNRWHFFFFSRGARHQMEGMMTGGFHQLVNRHCEPNSASPRP
jgi:hypothetical protein